MLSSGSRSQMGSSRPDTSQKRDSRWEGSAAISASQNARQRSSPALRHWDASRAAWGMVSRAAGRTRRTRSCTPPSSNMRDGAGRIRAARLDCALTMSRGLPLEPAA